LTSEERIELESLARSTKTEYRVRVKARIVLMAADGAATRGIAREVGCAIRIDPRRDMVLDPRRKIAQRRLVPSCRRVRTHIDAFINDYNETARPFAWTKSKVHQKHLKPCVTD
jgi:predicted phosphoadenosine phosphosulfate sulfurtransferase